MRRLFGRKVLVTLAALASFITVPAAGIVATATPAMASTTICTASGNHWCIGAASLSSGAAAVNAMPANGRQFNIVDKGFTCCGGFEVRQIQLAAAPTLCLGVHSDTEHAGGTITLRNCSGGNTNGTNWIRITDANTATVFWQNTTGAISRPQDDILTSDNVLGSQLEVLTLGCSPNCFQRWVPIN